MQCHPQNMCQAVADAAVSACLHVDRLELSKLTSQLWGEEREGRKKKKKVPLWREGLPGAVPLPSSRQG